MTDVRSGHHEAKVVLKREISKEQETFINLDSKDLLRPPLKQLGNSIQDIKQYFTGKDKVQVWPSRLSHELIGIKNDLMIHLNDDAFLTTHSIVTGDLIRKKQTCGLVLLSEFLPVLLDLNVHHECEEIICDVFIALPHQPLLLLTIADTVKKTQDLRLYNLSLTKEVKESLSKFTGESFNIVNAVVGETELKDEHTFQNVIETSARQCKLGVPLITLSMNPTKYKNVLTAFWAAVSELKIVDSEHSCIRFLTVEQCISIVENIDTQKVVLEAEPGCGLSTVLREVAERLSRLGSTLLVLREQQKTNESVSFMIVSCDNLAKIDITQFRCVIDETGEIPFMSDYERFWQISQCDDNDPRLESCDPIGKRVQTSPELQKTEKIPCIETSARKIRDHDCFLASGSSLLSDGPHFLEFQTNHGITVVPYKADVLEVNADAVVTREDDGFHQESEVTKSLTKHCEEFKQKRNKLVTQGVLPFVKKKHKLWSVKTTKLENSDAVVNFHFVFHAFMKFASECDSVDTWMENMKTMCREVLRKAEKYHVTTLALPLLGSSDRKDAAITVLVACVSEHSPTNLRKVFLVSKGKTDIHRVIQNCSSNYMVLVRGNQPHGYMTVRSSDDHLPGFVNEGTLIVTYQFPEGKQGPEHPNEGTLYQGTTRTAYLPNCSQGRLILGLLKTAFDRKLIFTISQNNVIRWRDIWHKTSIENNPNSRYCYPDSQYLDFMEGELAKRGVTKGTYIKIESPRA